MKIVVNKKEINTFKGARLGDVVRTYSARSYLLLEKGLYEIVDKYGNVTEPDGPAHEGQCIFIRMAKKETLNKNNTDRFECQKQKK